MKCLSLWQPWAQWVILGWKTIETRTHDRFKSLVGKRIAIHSAARWDNDWIQAMDFMSLKQVAETRAFYKSPKYAGGNVLGSVCVVEHRLLFPSDSMAAMVDCGDRDRFGLVLTLPRPLEMPILCCGRQGIFNISEL